MLLIVFPSLYRFFGGGFLVDYVQAAKPEISSGATNLAYAKISGLAYAKISSLSLHQNFRF